MQRLADIVLTDTELAAALAGDPTMRAALFRRLAPPTLGLIRRLVNHRALAEDLLQDTFIALFEHLADYRGEAPFGIWVRSIAVSRCLMAFRSPWNRARVALEGLKDDPRLGLEAGVPQGCPAAELIDLDRALARLSPITRTVVWLYDVEGWSHQEIARGFQRTVSFSKSQLARGHARLRRELSLPAPQGVGASLME